MNTLALWIRNERWTYPKGHLDVLAAPYVHALVVGAHFVEVGAIDGEQAASHGGRARRQRRVAVASHILALGYFVPSELEVVREAAVRRIRGRRVAEMVVVDDVDDRTRHGFSFLNNANYLKLMLDIVCCGCCCYLVRQPVLLDLVEERRQPADTGLAVRVQKGHRVAGGDLSAAQTWARQAQTLLVPQHDHFDGQCGYEVVQRFAQVRPIHALVVHQDDLGQVAQRRALHDAHECAQQGRVGLVVVHDDDACRGQVHRIDYLLTPVVFVVSFALK